MKKIIGSVILLIIFGFLIYIIYDIYRETEIKEYAKIEENINSQENAESINQNNSSLENAESINQNNSSLENTESINQNNSNLQNEKSTKQDNAIIKNKDVQETKNLKLVQKEYKGYTVSAKLEIEKLDIDTCVLEDSSKPAMEVAVAKYFGPEPNEIGNYCIAGHNYITKNMFSKLGKLEIGDTLTLTDNIHGAIEYTIYDKYKANPEQTQALSQRTNGEKEVTLITCSDYSKKRIIIKARAE